MDWLQDTNFFFVSSVSESPDSNFLIQVILIIAAAFLGAFASYLFSQISARRTRKAKLNSLAISSMRKISDASSALLAAKHSFFAQIHPDTDREGYWKLVKVPIGVQSNLSSFTDEEFEFLLGEEGTDKLVHRLMEFLNFISINEASLNAYSRYRETLSGMLAYHAGPINFSDGSSSTELDLEKHPDIAVKIYETNSLCLQIYDGIQEVTKMAREIIPEFNSTLPELTQNPKFGKRLQFDF